MYYAGIDLGTSSVGWALTDDNYKIIRKKGKDLWGVRLFDEAQTSLDRRTHRTARRRRQREIARIGLLKDYFEDAINEVDAGFYQRLEDSKYHSEEKNTSVKYALFADEEYTDAEYYRDYPTIFHLRKALLEPDKKYDVRLVFLAILNIYKHRGHFLNASLGDNEKNESIEELYTGFCCSIPDDIGINFSNEICLNRMIEVLCDKNYSKRQKSEILLEVFDLKKNQNKKEYELLKMLCGLSGKMETVFGKELLGEENAKLQLSFRDSGYDEKVANISEVLPDDCMAMLYAAKDIHDYALLNDIMKDCNYLSEARVKSYDKHKSDLKKLQYVFKTYAKEEYDRFFRVMADNNYSGYVGSVNSDREKQGTKGKLRRNRKASDEAFFRETKRILLSMPQEDETVQYLLEELEKESLLPKQLTFANGVIPNQVHLMELKKILKNAECYLPFLKEVDESGYTVSERIIQLFKFQIPYYVGPVNIKGESENCWVVRKEDGQVLPWNIEDKVDISKTREAFITRMIRQCTYLSGEKCLPKNSLLYEQFMVLNELNNLKIHGEKVPVNVKQDIYNVLFRKGKKVTRKQLENYLIVNGIISENEREEISGIDGDFHQALVSYGRFKAVFGDKVELWDYQQMAENIIFWGTVYSNDKKLMKQLITENYGSQSKNELLTNDQIKRILGFKWNDWGRLSKEFLELPGCSKSDGEIKAILDALWDTNDNLMELLSDRYTFIDSLNEKSVKVNKLLSEFTYDDLSDRYLSAPVKRMTWQTILIMKELCQVMGEAPAKIFVEMPREHGESGKRTVSRKKKLEDLYKQCGKEFASWQKEIADLSEDKFREKKIYLYYTQMGRCMYSGEAIHLDNLGNYDIDHIYPRHFVKDDSLDNNMVLVKKELNSHKSDVYPLESTIRKDRYMLWKSLLDKELITAEKFKRLTRSWDFTDEELAGFINRQIVETGQATKQVAHLLDELLPNTEIVYVKAGNVSAFRHRTDMLKSRVINDFHHAKDAYLNIVVGNAYHTKFTKNPMNFISEFCKDAKKNPYHMYKVFDYDIKRNGIVAWTAGEKGSIVTVRKMMEKNTPLVTKRTYEQHGGIADQTIYSASEANPEKYISIKASDERMADVTKYGGYSSVTGAYYFLVEHEKKGKKVRTLEQLPIYLKQQLSKEGALEEYCVSKLGLINPNIRLSKVPYKTLIKRDGQLLYIAGKTENRIYVENAMQMCLSVFWNNYIRHMENYQNKCKETDIDKIICTDSNNKLYEVILEKHKNVYKDKPNSLYDKLCENKEKFQKLKLAEQVEAILEILKSTQSKNFSIASKELNLKASSMKVVKDIGQAQEFVLINLSITGIYKTVIDLKTV